MNTQEILDGRTLGPQTCGASKRHRIFGEELEP